jgi:hypothetical protein
LFEVRALSPNHCILCVDQMRARFTAETLDFIRTERAKAVGEGEGEGEEAEEDQEEAIGRKEEEEQERGGRGGMR